MSSETRQFKASIDDIIAGAECLLPIAVIPNNMGINLCAVDSIEWTRQADGQLVSLTIVFNPA